MLSIVLPTYNESGNIEALIGQIAAVLKKRSFEVIVVDDNSPDKTWQKAETLSKEYSFLRVIRRTKEKGLSSAVVRGFDEAKGDTLLVMDSDMQHNPGSIVLLADALQEGADIAVASRYIEGGSVGDWVAGRRLLSSTATKLAARLPRVRCTDPMSGFFALKKSVYQHVRHSLRPTGFKILFEILSFLPKNAELREVPLVFAMRGSGESKLSFAVEVQFIWQLVRIAFLRVQKMLFFVVALCTLLVLLLRFTSLFPLYLSADVRSSVQTALQHVADEEGWLLSDIRIESVSKEAIIFIHQPHHRGKDEQQCFSLDLAMYQLNACEE